MANNNGENILSPAHVTDEREARSDVWVAILVQTNCERQVASKLEGASFHCYVAMQEEVHRWSDRLKKVQHLLIHNIVFVQSPKERFDELKHFSFVRGLMSNPGSRIPAVIPDEQIHNLQFMLGHADAPVSLESNTRNLKLGSKVRVVRGSFKGMEGNVCYLPDNDLRVGIQVGILGFAHVHINKTDIVEI